MGDMTEKRKGTEVREIMPRREKRKKTKALRKKRLEKRVKGKRHFTAPENETKHYCSNSKHHGFAEVTHFRCMLELCNKVFRKYFGSYGIYSLVAFPSDNIITPRKNTIVTDSIAAHVEWCRWSRELFSAPFARCAAAGAGSTIM